MNYKELFKISMSLISSPAKAWEEIRLEEDRRKVFGAFVYPMIGLCGLAGFQYYRLVIAVLYRLLYHSPSIANHHH